MYYEKLEQEAEAMEARNRAMKAAAKYRRADHEHRRREEAKPNRKKGERLSIRRADCERMQGRGDFKAPVGAYHKPGSNQ